MVKHFFRFCDRIQSLSRTISSVLNHSCSLVLSELEGVFLKTMEGQDFHGINDAFFGHFNHGKFPVPKVHVVFLVEIFFNRHLVDFPGSRILDVNQVLAGTSIDESLHLEVFAEHGATTVMSLDNQFFQTAMALIKPIRLRSTSEAVFNGPEKVDEVLRISGIEEGYGSTDKRDTSPEASVRNVDVYYQATRLLSTLAHSD